MRMHFANTFIFCLFPRSLHIFISPLLLTALSGIFVPTAIQVNRSSAADLCASRLRLEYRYVQTMEEIKYRKQSGNSTTQAGVLLMPFLSTHKTLFLDIPVVLPIDTDGGWAKTWAADSLGLVNQLLHSKDKRAQHHIQYHRQLMPFQCQLHTPQIKTRAFCNSAGRKHQTAQGKATQKLVQHAARTPNCTESLQCGSAYTGVIKEVGFSLQLIFSTVVV